MNRAQSTAVKLRRQLGLRGQVDAEAVANLVGLVVKPWPLKVQEEIQMGHFIGVAERLDPQWRRWVIAHAVGHKLMHPATTCGYGTTPDSADASRGRRKTSPGPC